MSEPQRTDNAWPRVMALLTMIGGAFAWFALNFEAVEPALSSPAIVMISMMVVYGLGGMSTYWLVAQPLETRLNKAEGVINRLREDERVMRGEMTSLRETLARHEMELKFLRGET